MIVKRVVMILLGILLLLGPVAAYYANPSGGTLFLPSDSTKTWIIADVGQQNVIKLVAYNNTPGFAGPVKNAQVSFTLDNPLLGSISPRSTATDNGGEALCTFTVNGTHPTSGTATITAKIISTDGGSATYLTILPYIQRIDHNVPYKASFSYSNEGTVESVIPVNISIFDRWDNQVDDKRDGPGFHNITLHVNGPSPPNDCGFTNYGLVHDKKFNLDLNGEVSVSITPATKPGWHYILMDPMGSIPDQMKMFNTVATGVPFSMTQFFSPDSYPPPATVLADGTSKFNFYYTLCDKYGNPTRNQSVWINTTVPGEETLRKSLENGQVWSTYGPKSFTGQFTIYATPVENPSLQLSKVVRFYNTTPTGIDLSANPQSMPSRDANPSIYSNITAKVTDIMGNGVSGETVTFSFYGVTDTPTDAEIAAMGAAYVAPSFSKTSSLLSASATTDSNGYATVRFYPASYATTNQPGYKQTVTGSAKITAKWSDKEKDEPVTWKNYPYLSAIVEVKPQQVKVGDSVDVSLKLNGDGWALYQYPVDVDLVLDRSGSMGYDISGVDHSPPVANQRITIAKNAATSFIGNMKTGQDRAGLFSYSSAGDVTNTAPQGAALQSPFGPVTTAVSSLSPTSATSTREAVKDAIADMIAHPNANSKAVRAVIVMTDGDWNNEGSPAAHGTGWPEGNPDITFSGNTLELTDYRYYSGLGGTLTPYSSTTTCDVCASGYTLQTSGRHIGQCQWTNYNYNYYTPASKPSSCPTPRPLSKCTNGEFTEQNLSVYAKNHNVRLYFIFFAGNPDTDAEKTLKAMAEATGGLYQQATTAAALNDAYTKIAGDLRTEAGVNTRVSMDFGHLIVNGALVAPGSKIFDYVGDPVITGQAPSMPPGSTMLDKYNKTPSGQINQHLVPGSDVDGHPFTSVGPIIINQTNYWNTDPHKQNLSFNIGTVYVNETWETNFRLKVLESGNILVFGPQSQVCFTNGEDGNSCMTLPNISVYSNMTPLNLGVAGTTINIVGLTRSDDGLVKDTLPATWTTVYNGADQITEEVSYIHENDPPVKFDVKTLNPAFDLVGSQSSLLNMEKLPPGGTRSRSMPIPRMLQ